MNIEYKDIHNFEQEKLERLFLSVEWSSGHFPDKLAISKKAKKHRQFLLHPCGHK